MTPSQLRLRYHLGQPGFPLAFPQECPAGERPPRPAGPPLSARPSHPCSTRLQGPMLCGVLVHPQCRRVLVVWAPLLPPMLGPCSLWATPTLVAMTMRGEGGGPRQHDMGALHFGTRRDLWLAVGTVSWGPSGKKDPGWCRGTLPGASPHRL